MVSDPGPSRAEYLIRTCRVRVPFTAAGAPKPEAPRGPTAGRVATNRKDGLPYVYIPRGRFRMGCSEGDTECSKEEYPPHNVSITKGFWMGQTEVTVEAYKRFARATGRTMPQEPVYFEKNLNPGWNEGGAPMTMVTWTEAHDYCKWAGLRLPTEAEWEYAARAGTSGSRYGSLDSVAWFGDNSGDKVLDTAALDREGAANFVKRIVENGNHPHTVGRKQANAFHLYDMLGNVWEWTADWYNGTYYAESPEEDPRGRRGGELEVRVLRGGSWIDQPNVVRVSSRAGGVPTDRLNLYGFRCSGKLPVP